MSDLPLDPLIDSTIDQFAAGYAFPLDDFQRDAIRVLLEGDSVLVAAPTGTGKALAHDTPVLTPSGWTPIANLRPRDHVVGADGRPTQVTGVFPQGIRPAYRVTFSDGVSVVCDLDHLWAVNTKSRRHAGQPWRALTLREILAEGLTDGLGYRHFIPLVRPVSFEPRARETEVDCTLAAMRAQTGLTQRALATKMGVSQTAIAYRETGRYATTGAWRERVVTVLEEAGPRPRLEPYLLWLLLGDGGLSTGFVRFSSADDELLSAIPTLLAPSVELRRVSGGSYDWVIGSRESGRRNPIATSLRELGLWGHKAEAKFVPDAYKFASASDRLAVLQGLLDTDGSVDRRGIVEYVTVSPQLAADVAFLVRSLGGRTQINPKRSAGQLAFRLYVSLPPDLPPFRLSRKALRYKARNGRHPTRAIASVEPIGEAEMVCIAVDAPDGLFVVNDFIVTHNTVVAEFGIWESLKRTGRVLYTTPIKALSNQKYRDLRAVYGDAVGLLTGDVSENRDARIVVMTTEVLRNMLLQSPWDLDTVECVIFDEIHYLADPERGTTWEESIILCPEHVKLICLSATVSNADEIAAWISRGHRPIRLITHNERAVPLALHYYYDNKLHLTVDHTGKLVKDFPHTGGELRRQAGRRAGFGRKRGERSQPEMDEPQPREIVDALAAADMLPAIYFLFSRNDCQAFAERLAVMRPNLISERQESLIEQTITAVLATMRPEDRQLAQVQTITDLARKGIGFHHAGLLPILKQLVELLFSRGLMEVVFATDTLALGVNMPARTVVVGRMSKWDGRRRRLLIPNEFQQMAGRAGRRGMDKFGHVVVPYSPWFSFRETIEIGTGELEPVRSAFAIRYNTVLNLWDPPDGERVRAMLLQSLAQFQSSQRIRSLDDEIIDVGDQINQIPQGCLIGLDAGDELLEDYRRLNRSLTAAQNKERRLESDQAVVERVLDSATPWTEPGRQALRRAFRSAPPGLVAHTRDWGWGIYLNRGAQGGVGRFLFAPDGDIRLVQEYRQINQVTDRVITIPDELANVDGGVTSAAELNSGVQLDEVWSQLRDLDLPDLNALAAAHRASERARIDDTLHELDAEIEDARQQSKAMQRERLTHPCHTCDRRNEHRDYLKLVDRLDRDRRGLEERLSREIEAEEDRIRGVIRGIRNVLHRFGYLHRGYPTAKADMLAAVFDTDGLILCELVERGTLDSLPPEDLAEVFSWFSFDRDFRNSNRFVLPDRLVLARRRIEDVEHSVLGEERAEGLDVSEGHNPSFYGAARAWCTGATMAEISEVIDLSEGDLVLTFNKTIDLMRQVREMLADVDPGHPLHRTLVEAERLMKRDIVEQSLLLGFLPMTLPEPLLELVAEPEQPRARGREIQATPRSRSKRKQAADEAAPAPKKRARKQAAPTQREPPASPKQPRRRRGQTPS